MKIRTVNLTRSFRVGSSEITAVKAANLEINEPKLVTVIGPSGSGKSTLLNLIGLNDYPTSGEVFIDDSDTSQLSASERRKIRSARIGFVFQTFNLFPTLSALENVELPMSLVNKSQEEQRERAMKLLETVGLTHRQDHRPKQLSMGEMQRVAIARALANRPEIIIADEPTGELDSATAKEIISLLQDINHLEKTTVVVATHDEKIVDAADLVYTMQDGELKPKRGPE
ncbi:MAG: ABC transporter ATP-binding protein [Candidatus Bathyarchaeia archaeon]|jgi:putative ABC transport system ATP-binding protein